MQDHHTANFSQVAFDFLSDVEQREQHPHISRRRRIKALLASRVRRNSPNADTPVGDLPAHLRRKVWQKNRPDGEVITREKALYIYGHRCYLCDKALDRRWGIHLDHVIPLSRGGEHSMRNIRPSCPGCNLSKQNRLWHELDKAHPEMARRIKAVVDTF